MIQIFGVSQGHISSIVNDLASNLYTQFQPVLYWNPVRLSLQQLQLYVAAVTATVGVQELGIWGFIDRTVQPIARPLVGQEEYSSGEEGYHGIKFQSIVTPDGLISSSIGPEFGSKGDWKLWQQSSIERYLRNFFSESPILCLYGDPPYASAYGIIGPYRATARNGITPAQEAMNVTMSSYRIVVEWGFANVLNQFGFGEWKRNQGSNMLCAFRTFIQLSNMPTRMELN